MTLAHIVRRQQPASSRRVHPLNQFLKLDRQLDVAVAAARRQAEETVCVILLLRYISARMALAHIVQEEQQPAAAVYRPDQFMRLLTAGRTGRCRREQRNRQPGVLRRWLPRHIRYTSWRTSSRSKWCRVEPIIMDSLYQLYWVVSQVTISPYILRGIPRSPRRHRRSPGSMPPHSVVSLAQEGRLQSMLLVWTAGLQGGRLTQGG
ncbi:unnamed protein product [Chrysodeixis includens]|uniref:Uncharacterized protein n=1 Tax=Chrysodeixis includens TaxID=689277 RepID=A0A9N8L779_CHRIL|nr:unnamed protein product [Chrysodeixis includens]